MMTRVVALGAEQDRLDSGATWRVEASDGALMAAMAAGDRAAFAQLAERHVPGLIRLAERVIGHAQDAEDIAQEAMVRAWRKAPDWREDGAARLSTWLYRVALNLAIDRRRKPRHEPLEAAEHAIAPGALGPEVLLASQRALILRACMANLPERQHKAIALAYFADLAPGEAAMAMDLAPQAFDALLYRARQGLKAALRQRGFGQAGDLL